MVAELARILIVDDEEDTCDFLFRRIERLGSYLLWPRWPDSAPGERKANISYESSRAPLQFENFKFFTIPFEKNS